MSDHDYDHELDVDDAEDAKEQLRSAMGRAEEIETLFDQFTSLYDLDTEHDTPILAAAVTAHLKEN